jgi:hypothetical protein
MELLALLVRRPWVAALFSAAFALGFGYLGSRCWRDLQAFEGGPRAVALEEALVRAGQARIYAVVEGARFRCGEALHDVLRPRSTFVPLAGAGGETVLVAEYDRSIGCAAEAARPLIGVVSELPERMRTRLVEAGMALPASTVRHLCSYCGPDNARTGVIVCSVLVMIAVGLFPLILLLRRSVEQEGHPEATAGEVRAAGAIFVGMGALSGWLGAGWTLYGLVPFRVVSAIAVLIGLAMIVAPRHPLVKERAERLRP